MTKPHYLSDYDEPTEADAFITENCAYHTIYQICIDTIPIYVGYVHNRELKDRLREHIQKAKNPSKTEQTNRIVRGRPTDKDLVLLAALECDAEITIHPLLHQPAYIEVDEEEFIQLHKSQGHPITNVAKGCKFQPLIKLPNGTIVEAERGLSEHESKMLLQKQLRLQKAKTARDKAKKTQEKFDKKNFSGPLRELTEDELREAYNHHCDEIKRLWPMDGKWGREPEPYEQWLTQYPKMTSAPIQ